MPNSARKRPQTENDLRAIWNYIASDSIKEAEAMLDRIEQVFDMLADAPLTGRARGDLLTGLRSFPVKSYIIFYTVLSDGIEVVRVMHSKQDISAKHMN